MTEKTNKTVNIAQGTLFFDGTCGFCIRWINRIRKPLASIGVEVAPFENGADESEMILHWHDGTILGGADAAIFLARRFPLGFIPATIAGCVPFIYLVRAAYKRIAQNRHCSGNDACKIDFGKKPAKPGWLVTAILIALPVGIGAFAGLTGWVWMWLINVGMWLGFKIMCYRKAGGFPEIDILYFLWPGMDTAGFAYETRGNTKSIPVIGATIFLGIGIALLLAIPTFRNPIATGWAGIVAMLCLMHFGGFVWLARFWNQIGFNADPIMRKPWVSQGLGDFWGNRWNRGFSDWSRIFLFRPLTAKFGVRTGTMAGFLASGITHELAISVPARGGYGLPTLYFLIQGIGLLIEKRTHLRRRGLARIWLWILVLVPAPLLFHTAFIENVFNPMTNLITNLWTH